MSTRKLAALATALLTMMALVAVIAMPAVGDGNDSPEACELALKLDVPEGDPQEREATVTASEGYVIDAICIKSGDDAFGDKQHSGLITADGTYSGFTVVGIGTDSVTVTAGEDIKDISHIDYRQVEVEEPDPANLTSICYAPTPGEYEVYLGSAYGFTTVSVDNANTGILRVWNPEGGDIPAFNVTLGGPEIQDRQNKPGNVLIFVNHPGTVKIEGEFGQVTKAQNTQPCDEVEKPAFEVEYGQSCGMVTAEITENRTGFPGQLSLVLGSEVPLLNDYPWADIALVVDAGASLGYEFAEDYNDGEVIVTIFAHGPEQDTYAVDGKSPYFQTLTVDTDCEPEETTTTTTSTTVPEETTTTTTVPPRQGSTTTTTVVPSTTPTTTPSTTPDTLPFTGPVGTGAAGLGLVALLSGLGLTLLARKGEEVSEG